MNIAQSYPNAILFLSRFVFFKTRFSGSVFFDKNKRMANEKRMVILFFRQHRPKRRGGLGWYILFKWNMPVELDSDFDFDFDSYFVFYFDFDFDFDVVFDFDFSETIQ